MVSQKSKIIRNMRTRAVEDPGNIQNLTYNQASGGQKNLSVGPHLKPLVNAAGGWTTDASTIRALDLGAILAIYNNDTSVHAVRFSSSGSATALAAGVVDATTGDVGVPCTPGTWNYLSNYDKRFIITDSNKLLVFLIKDETRIKDESIEK